MQSTGVSKIQTILFAIILMPIMVVLSGYLLEVIELFLTELTSTSRSQLFFVITGCLEGLVGFILFLQLMKVDALSWELVDEISFCKIAGKPSGISQIENELPEEVVTNDHAASNASEAGLFMTLMMLFIWIILMSFPVADETFRPSYALYMSAFMFIVILIPLYATYRSQTKYGKFKEFWKSFWKHALSFIKYNTIIVMDSLYAIPTSVQYPFAQGGYSFTKDYELDPYRKQLEKFKHNPFTLELDDPDLEDKVHAVVLIAKAQNYLQKYDEIVIEIQTRCPSLQNAINYFDSIIDIWIDYENETIMKNLIIVEGLEIASICPEAYIDLESARDGSLDDNDEAVALAVDSLRRINSMPGVAVPNSIKYLAAYIALIFALTPFAAMLLTPFF